MNKIDICEEFAQNFIDYSYEANSQRAFPDARDGLKPGQRACLWEMYTKGYTSNKPHVKSAKISGGTIACWWPHGDVSVYETFARMSQQWINNLPEVDWHGANGNQIMGSRPASSRYTEARLSKIAEDGMFQNIKKNNVNMIPNFLEDDKWPEVLPALFPRLMVNGSEGIGVTIANSWLCHSFNEVANVLTRYMTDGILDYSNLYPSFPSGGIIINKDEVHTIYETGRGKVILRGTAEIKGKSIFITELPYQVYVEPYIDSVKELIKNDEITGIDDILNKSDKKHPLLIEIVCESNPDMVLLDLYRKTALQSNYNANQWALVGKTPRLLTLKDYCEIYVNHNLDCLQREINFDLDKSEKRLHIVDGLIIAIEDIDNIIALIKQSTDAKKDLIARYPIDEEQAKAILDVRLAKLAKLEVEKLMAEREELKEFIESLHKLLSSKELQLVTLRNRLQKLVDVYSDDRRTRLEQIELPKAGKKEKPEIIPEDCVVVITESGLVKKIPTKSFRTQKRNSAGVKNGDDIISYTAKTNTVDTLMVFSNTGRMFRLAVNLIPEGTNVSRGVSLRTLVKMEDNELPIAYSSLKNDTTAKYVFFATKKGIVKRVPLNEYRETKRATGIIALSLREGDLLAAVTFIEEENIMLFTKKGMSIRFASTELPISSRTAQGVKGINLAEDDEVITCLPIHKTTDYLTIVSADGLGKKVDLKEFNLQGRGGRGLIVCKDEVAGAAFVDDSDSLLISGNRTSVKIDAKDIPLQGRSTQGVMLIKDNDRVVSISKI